MEVGINPIPTSQGQNQPLYECHVTKSGRNRVKVLIDLTLDNYSDLFDTGVTAWEFTDQVKCSNARCCLANKYPMLAPPGCKHWYQTTRL